MTKISLHALAATAIIAVTALAAVSPVQAQQRPPRQTTPNYPEPSPTTYSCSEELGHLRRVHASEFAPVQDPTQVWVTPICVGDSMFRSDGNAGALRMAIAANEAMADALGDQAFTPDDVVGVRMTGPANVTLYVYPFHR